MIFATLLFYAGATFFLGIIAVPWAAPAGQMFGFEDLFVTVEGALTVALPLVFIALAVGECVPRSSRVAAETRAGSAEMMNARTEILITGAHAIAHGDGLKPTLQVLVDSVSDLGASSAAIVIAGRDGALEIAASLGLDDGAAAGLTAAIVRPTHPIARTMHETSPTFDVAPTVPADPPCAATCRWS